MGIIGILVLGLVIGVIAKAINNGPEPGGIIGSIIVGVVGAFVGALLANALGFGESFPPEEFFDLSLWISAIIGALIVLFIYKLVVGRGSNSPAHR